MGCGYQDWERSPGHFVDWALAYADAESRHQREQIDKVASEAVAKGKSRWWRRGG